MAMLIKSLQSKHFAQSLGLTLDESNNCLSPVKFNDTFYPCRNCIQCLEKRKEQWIFRSLIEREKYARAWFITLTYDDIGQYDYKNVQKFLKRIRHKTTTLSFICTDEYDSKGKRDYNPHHHMVIYCDNTLSYRDIKTEWTLGHSKCDLLKNRSASYVAKYLTKHDNRIRASGHFGEHSAKPLLKQIYTNYNKRIRSPRGNDLVDRRPQQIP